MKNNEIALRPSYWAAVSGGKDSLFMLNLILHNLDKYPLDGVVHYELEIDYPFIKEVIDYMETECNRYGIPFVRIKPTTTWEELYKKYGFPTRVMRWCNDKYKTTAKKVLDQYLEARGFYLVLYIGYCADEEKRFTKRTSLQKVECYPLVDAGIKEQVILDWAKEQPIFNNYYKTQKRCGCMYCPMASYLNLAYLYKYYPANFNFMIQRMKESEDRLFKKFGRKITIRSGNYSADYVDRIVKEKWKKILEEKEKNA